MADQYRPQIWEEYIGQTKLKDTLQIKIGGALDRVEMLDDILLYGPPGCGKTSIASLIAQEMDCDFESFVMPIKENVLKQIVSGFTGIVLFDELHRLSDKRQEELLPLIEDDYLQLPSGQRIYSGALTIVGATTELDKIISPLYDRFFVPPFDPYTDEEMALIVKGMSAKADLDFGDEVCFKLGRAAGGIPRNAKNFIGMAKDLNSKDYKLILRKCRVTEDGLTEMHIRYLRALINCGGVAGVDIIGSHLGMPKSSIIDLEKLLIRRNMIEYTKQGRSILGAGYAALKKKKG